MRLLQQVRTNLICSYTYRYIYYIHLFTWAEHNIPVVVNTGLQRICIKFRMHCLVYVHRTYTWQSQTKKHRLSTGKQGAYYTRSSQTPGSHVSCSLLLLYYYYLNAKCIKPIWLCRTTHGNEFFFRGIYMTTTQHILCTIRRHATVTA